MVGNTAYIRLNTYEKKNTHIYSYRAALSLSFSRMSSHIHTIKVQVPCNSGRKELVSRRSEDRWTKRSYAITICFLGGEPMLSGKLLVLLALLHVWLPCRELQVRLISYVCCCTSCTCFSWLLNLRKSRFRMLVLFVN